jgi:hypothetical protein
MSETLLIRLSKNEEGSFGFSVLGKFAGIPHVIYEVIEDSPASDEVSDFRLHKKIHSLFFRKLWLN